MPLCHHGYAAVCAYPWAWQGCRACTCSLAVRLAQVQAGVQSAGGAVPARALICRDSSANGKSRRESSMPGSAVAQLAGEQALEYVHSLLEAQLGAGPVRAALTAPADIAASSALDAVRGCAAKLLAPGDWLGVE